ncbi:MerR family transcriptional regulator [Nonomuraea sp. MCN248]|uniref:MerR family transcriptional regulator n=1 Tax=Nonomuraea corallina TaxID=2989783 RepID=A0ABT4SCZ2_9ACTN|nr:MerR family transcriptional regulator [Nonomuraea corallina]MDA0635076.1 MerR family transcriptional regulator [Nonomuraea corallina]
MRIGELAALVGVSTRTVRHYHRLGLLPEPARTAGGYREYRLRDAVLLARVRRLAELGLSLDEVRDVLADDRGRDLREVLLELDADLARQQEALAARRARLAALLEEDELRPDSAVSPGMAAVLRDLTVRGSRAAEMDREMLTLMDTTAGPGDRDEIVELMRPLAGPGMRDRSQELYRRLDELGDARPDDPRVRELAADAAAHLPDELVRQLVGHLPSGGPWFDALLEELTPAQAEVFRLMVDLVRERT